MTKGAQSGARDALEGLGRDGREIQDRGDIGICMADAHCCRAETNKTL